MSFRWAAVFNFISNKNSIFRTTFLTHGGGSSLREGLNNLKVFISCPQVSDNFDSAIAIEKFNLGPVISKTPSEFELKTAISDVHKNMKIYQNNVQNIVTELSTGAVAKLEKFVDELVAEKRTVQFDYRTTMPMSYGKAFTIMGTVMICVTSPVWFSVLIICKLCRKSKSKKLNSRAEKED